MGRKRLLIAGLVVSIAGAAGCIFATSYEGFMAFRLLQAVGCGCFVLSQGASAGGASMLVASIRNSLPMSLALGFIACSLAGWYLLIYLKGLERCQRVCDSGPIPK
ncbi:hypothetical protein ACIPW4_12400 [Pseudomonas sp. NPDC089996]|uniref:hypothetical protein n=1 Tax=Pseudomonas sp. NPDC089996 TaxID=3364474 RepID=UPI003822403E